MFLSRMIGVTVVLCIVSGWADVVVDNMNGTGKQSASGGYWFVTWDGKTAKSETVPVAPSSQIVFPNLNDGFAFYDLSLAPVPAVGSVACLNGVIGSYDEYPFIAMGFNLTRDKDTLDLSGVTHFAFRARGKGAWGMKFKTPVADTIAVAMAKLPGQVDWRNEFVALDSAAFTWIVLTPADFLPTTKAFSDALKARNLTVADGLKRCYQFQWQTVGYTRADSGAAVWLQIDDFILLGALNKIGTAALQPTAEQKAAILSGLSVVFGTVPRRAPAVSPAAQGLYSVQGRTLPGKTQTVAPVVRTGHLGVSRQVQGF